jgi:hypothetical protein
MCIPEPTMLIEQYTNLHSKIFLTQNLKHNLPFGVHM